jgi:hypothetical protein
MCNGRIECALNGGERLRFRCATTHPPSIRCLPRD